MKRLIIVLCFLMGGVNHCYCQSVNDLGTVYTDAHLFTVQDLYKWRQQMNFKPLYPDINKFDNLILRMKWEACRQWLMKARVTWEQYLEEGENNSYWFVFRDGLKKNYGITDINYIKTWYIPLYCLMDLDMAIYQPSQKKN